MVRAEQRTRTPIYIAVRARTTTLPRAPICILMRLWDRRTCVCVCMCVEVRGTETEKGREVEKCAVMGAFANFKGTRRVLCMRERFFLRI